MSESKAQVAERLGRELGHSAGTWVIDGNTTQETARSILDGYNDGDPAVMDMAPSPLSGEWADGPFLPDVLEQITGERDYAGDDTDDLLIALEDAYSDAYWAEVIRSAQAIVD
jgi:hypothetical protein